MKLIRDDIAALYHRYLRGEITREQYASMPARNGVVVEDTDRRRCRCTCSKCQRSE